jgi:Uma2 family endonuclease
MDAFEGLLPSLLPPDWFVRCQRAVTLGDSEPEPDYAVVRGPRNRYRDSHPTPADIGLVVEFSVSSLRLDRTGKGRIYARAGIPVYWVVNVADKVIEVYTQPVGTGDAAAYGKRDDYPVGTAVPVVLGGAAVGTVTVAAVLG